MRVRKIKGQGYELGAETRAAPGDARAGDGRGGRRDRGRLAGRGRGDRAGGALDVDAVAAVERQRAPQEADSGGRLRVAQDLDVREPGASSIALCTYS
jgi:hypothetical protein